MGFCKSCGEALSKKDSFCSRCGTATGFVNEDMSNFTIDFKEQLKDEFKIKRCPSCGEGIPSFVAICPACGNEMRSAKITETLENFIVQVDQCEKNIAKKQKIFQTGFMGWSNQTKVLWIFLNIFLLCIPLVLYMILPMIRMKMKPSLSIEETELATLIENYPIPNERASILETLVYAKEKIDFLSKESIDRKTAFWIRLWSQKAEQMKEKAEILFPNDKVVKQTYEEIIKDRKSVNRVIRIKAILGFVLLGVIILIFAKWGAQTSEKIEEEKKLIFPQTELSKLIPVIEGVEGRVKVSSSENLVIDCDKIPLSMYEDYKKKCIDMGFAIDPEELGSGYEAYNKDGCLLKLSYYDTELYISLRATLKMRNFKLPNNELAKLLPPLKSNFGLIQYATTEYLTMYIGQTSIEDYDAYVEKCMEYGFNQKINQYEKSFSGKNKDGYSMRVRYEGFQTMYVDIQVPNDY